MIKLKIFTLILLATIPFLYLNCSGDDGAAGAIKIPAARSECSSLAASQCTFLSNNKLLFIGMTEDTSLDCGNAMTGTNISQLHQLFSASNISATEFDVTHSIIFATHPDWRASTNLTISILENKEYLFCAFIDSNNDGFLNAGEPILRQQHILSDLDHLKLENWNDN